MNQEHELDEIIKLLADVIEARSVLLFLYRKEESALTLAAAQSSSKNLDHQVKLAPGDGVVGWVLKNEKPLNLATFERDEQALRYYSKREETGSILAVPLGRPRGVLLADSPTKHFFTERHFRLLEQFSDMICRVLRHHQVSQRGRLYADLLDLVYRMDHLPMSFNDLNTYFGALLRMGLEFSGQDLVFMTLLNSDGRTYRIELSDGRLTPKTRIDGDHPVEKGMVGRVMSKGTSLVMKKTNFNRSMSYAFSPKDNLNEFKSFIGLPITNGDNIRGAVCFLGLQEGAWEPDRIHVLSMLVKRISHALETQLENARQTNLAAAANERYPY
ncbi:MAG: GAF domain-containing protein [Deltaproteobacteria bacterium]|nr:GAF domain-containing protein [Deltaproteobacteria bacterium]